MAGTSEGAAKAAKTRKRNEGKNVFKKQGAKGGAHTKRGYFGTLKDQGRLDELKKVSLKGALATNQIKAKRKDQGTESGV